MEETATLQAAPDAATDTGEGKEDPDEGMSASKKKREKAKAAAARKKAAGGGTNSDSIANGGGGGGSGGTTAAAAPSGPTEDASARFQALLDALKEGREAPVAQLARCGLGDKKLRMLASAVRTRGAQCAIQTLDLAHNVVSDAGAAQLCAALTSEGRLAPRLTLLSLVGNPLGDAGAELCAKMLEERPEVALILPELSQPPAGSMGGAGESARAVDTYFACRSEGDVPPAWQGPPAQGADGRVEVGTPVLASMQPPDFDKAVALLASFGATGVPNHDGDAAELVDALRVVLCHVEAESDAPVANTKLLPRGLKWCSQHLCALHALLLPPPRPRVSYGEGPPVADAWARRLGARRLLVVEILDKLVNAKRPVLTTALAEPSPPLLSAAVHLLYRHPASGVLGAAVLRLVRSALLAKPLRLALLSGGGGASGASQTTSSLPALLSAALCTDEGAPGGVPLASRPLWLEIASAIDKAAATDKQAKTLLQADPRWTEVSEQLAPMRERLLPEHPSLLWTCGAPPARMGAAGGMGGEMDELIRLLRSMPTPSS